MSSFEHYQRVRQLTRALIEPLGPEDCMVQAMPDVSPPKWHLAHTTWFFETFVLEPHASGYRSPSPAYKRLFNSYYEAVGPRHPRPERGQLSRPSLSEVLAYRDHVDACMRPLLEQSSLAAPSSTDPSSAGAAPGRVRELIELGLHHEQQHQELLVMDTKYNFSRNPLAPAYARAPLARGRGASVSQSFEPQSFEPQSFEPQSFEPQSFEPQSFERFEGGLVQLGASADGFAFDNERPLHRRFLEPFELSRRLVTNGDMLEFIAAGGYDDPALWLSDGWAWVREHDVAAPLYWRRDEGGAYHEFTAHGEQALDPARPVCHVSGFEALAFATFAGARLPTEFEWEVAARAVCAAAAKHGEPDPRLQGGLEVGVWHPRAATGAGVCQLFGELWQWTRSAYEPYPGFAPAAGAVGEYNGKFMCGQWVLRGGAVVTPRGHSRSTYRNFFYPHQRWPFTGIRLAREAR
jgi:ergothioneine biosynthesis protein EgtB